MNHTIQHSTHHEGHVSQTTTTHHDVQLPQATKHHRTVEASLKAEAEENLTGNPESEADLQLEEIHKRNTSKGDLKVEVSEEEAEEEPLQQEDVPKKRTRHAKAKVRKKCRVKRNATRTDTQVATSFSYMRKRRQDLTLGAKVKVLEMLDQEPKVPQGKIASMFHVSQSQVSRIMKNKDAIMAQWNRFATPDRKRCRLGKAGALEQKLVDWYKEAKKEDLPISGPILMEKAKSIGNEMGVEFKPSAGWLGRWKDRNGVTLKRFKDKDGAPSAMKVGNHWRRYMFTKATKEYSLENVWVVDETVLTCNALPEYLTHRMPAVSERVSIVLTCNLAGTERRPALVVGKTEALVPLTLPILYHHHPKAAITREIFHLWLMEWDRELRTKRKKIVLLMNKAHYHPENPHVFNINVTFFPPDTSTVLHPLRLGIMNTFKSIFRYQQHKFIMAKTHAVEQLNHSNMINHSNQPVPSLTQCVSPLDTLFMIYKAWKHVSPETIVKGVVKAGLSKDVDALNVSDQVHAPPGMSQSDFEALVASDEGLDPGEQEDNQSDQALDSHISMMPNIQYPNYSNVYSSSGSKGHQMSQHIESSPASIPAPPSVSEAVRACQILRDYLQQRGGQLFDEFSEVESSIHLDMILETRPDLRNELKPDPLHDSNSVHCLEAHQVVLEQKLDYLQKLQAELEQQKIQKEIKKVTQTSASTQNSHNTQATPPQEIRTNLHNHPMGMSRSDVPSQDYPRQEMSRQDTMQQLPQQQQQQQPVHQPDQMRQNLVRPEYQNRTRASLIDLRTVNMTNFRPIHPDLRNEGANNIKNDSLGLPADLRNLSAPDHRTGTEIHHQGLDMPHGMRQPDGRLDNPGIPYYAISNPLPHYMQPK
ncbi:hypothetical protein Pcinc_036579 [Petrolisthes cinctipes]|uniref:HTH CENPB-type domain-containing protein n=1 Tax=Petrolisthes cinctipes TaxID=88211 RepID=A0AAE1BU96_PETCI|nr:hypothetical protein Pcinc_036579 [Petrolisthes cinctipes]